MVAWSCTKYTHLFDYVTEKCNHDSKWTINSNGEIFSKVRCPFPSAPNLSFWSTGGELCRGKENLRMSDRKPATNSWGRVSALFGFHTELSRKSSADRFQCRKCMMLWQTSWIFSVLVIAENSGGTGKKKGRLLLVGPFKHEVFPLPAWKYRLRKTSLEQISTSSYLCKTRLLGCLGT